jgi:hypothetical protein
MDWQSVRGGCFRKHLLKPHCLIGAHRKRRPTTTSSGLSSGVASVRRYPAADVER